MLRVVSHTVPRVGRSYEHFPDGFELHLLPGDGKDGCATRAGTKEMTSATPELTRGNRKGQNHEFAGKLTSKVDSKYLSRSQWLQLPNPTARRRISIR